MDEFRTEIRFGRVGCILHTVFHEASGIVSCAMLTLLGKSILKYKWLIIRLARVPNLGVAMSDFFKETKIS